MDGHSEEPEEQPQAGPQVSPGYRPKAYERSVVLGGGLVLFPLADPPSVAATLHIYADRLWKAAFEAGRKEALGGIKRALEL